LALAAVFTMLLLNSRVAMIAFAGVSAARAGATSNNVTFSYFNQPGKDVRMPYTPGYSVSTLGTLDLTQLLISCMF
jgi:hypothetical protein